MNPSTPPKGSLEELFRHHLLESEAAAVPPRPQLWEQLDNSLLLAQNEQYRRRLRAHRWAIAASLLVASLASGGWWHTRQQAPGLAETTGPATATSAHPAAVQPAALGVGTNKIDFTSFAASTVSTFTSPAIDPSTTLSASAIADARTTLAGLTSLQTGSRRLTTQNGSSSLLVARPSGSYPAATPIGGRNYEATYPATVAYSKDEAASLAPAASAGLGMPLSDGALISAFDETGSKSAASSQVAVLVARTAALVVPTSSLPSMLNQVPVNEPAPTKPTRNWQYGLSYAAGAFQPNVDFTKPTTSYNVAFGTSSALTTQAAAAEYRSNLRAGLGQRLSLWATRRLGASRWGLRTGLELTQTTATSASSVAFTGEQVADLVYTQAMQPHLQRTSYHYRSASVPVEVRYTNPIKSGFSLYGRVGALFTALLNARSEVDGSPEAAHSYSLLSTGSPYRHLSGSMRAGAGMQFRPVGHQWTLNLGPVAEMGILSLNADPAQDFMHQQRPIALGWKPAWSWAAPSCLSKYYIHSATRYVCHPYPASLCQSFYAYYWPAWPVCVFWAHASPRGTKLFAKHLLSKQLANCPLLPYHVFQPDALQPALPAMWHRVAQQRCPLSSTALSSWRAASLPVS
ncbi:hypothetical protein [Hymenobacter sp. BRD67]|uniref:hypothetical protein n=1 Tax=Hymenobacter sp. BRD67 TaxID=2675877 RepID=UPI00156461DA|nr:hypothetical protein [Hymenobacter sp. BRD67]QKG53784.1 hypothetical protein GKZ67_15735 [Hymenobacter sp. BRD67]